MKSLVLWFKSEVERDGLALIPCVVITFGIIAAILAVHLSSGEPESHKPGCDGTAGSIFEFVKGTPITIPSCIKVSK